MKKKRNLSAMPIPYRRGNKWGFCDTEMNILIPIVYDEVRPFKENQAAVKLGVYWGFIGIKGDLIIETRYITVSDFLEGKSIVQCKESNCKLIIDEKGNVIGEYNNYSVKTDEYTIDRTSIKSGDDYEIKYIYCDNYKNKILPPPPFDYYNSAGKFINGIALVNGDMFIDKQGKPAFDVKLLTADTFSEGYSAVRFADKSVGYISEKGEKFVCRDFDETKSFQGGLAAVKMKGKWKFIDKTFEVAFKEGFKYENWQGDKIIDGFDETKVFSKGFAAVRLGEKWGFINTRGEIVIGFKYENPTYANTQDSYYLFKDDLAKVLSKEKNYFQNDESQDKHIVRILPGYIDSTGKEYFESIFRIRSHKLNFYSSIEVDQKSFLIIDEIMELLDNGDWNKLRDSLRKIVDSNEINYRFNKIEAKLLKKVSHQIKELGIQISQLNKISDNLICATKLLEINLLAFVDCLSSSDYKNLYNVLEPAVSKWRKIKSHIKLTIIKLDNENSYLTQHFKHYSMNSYCYNEYEKKYIVESLTQKLISYIGENQFNEIYFLFHSIDDFFGGIELDQSPQNIYKIKRELPDLKPLIDKLTTLNYSILNSDSYNICLDIIGNSKILVEECSSFNKQIKKLEIDSTLNEANIVIELLIKKPNFFSQIISAYYPFEEEEISQFEDYLNWEMLSKNKNILFTGSLINRFENRWYWFNLAKNESIHWTAEMIEQYKSYLSRPNHVLGNPMSTLCENSNVDWNIRTINKLKEIIDWEALSRNAKLSWGADIIREFKYYWDWKALCLHGKFWTKTMIISLKNELNHNLERWNFLISNAQIEWSMDFILSFKEKWFAKRPIGLYHDYDFHENSKIPWDKNFLDTFEEKLNWYRLSKSKYLPWSGSLIDKYIDRWDWKELSQNLFIKWNEDLINRFEKNIVFVTEYKTGLVNNPEVLWNEKIIDKFIDMIDWIKLSESENMNWTSHTLLKYADKINWSILDKNKGIKWSEEMLNIFSDKMGRLPLSKSNRVAWNKALLHQHCNALNWENISSNTDINWDYDLINSFKDYINWKALSNNSSVTWNLNLIKEFCTHMIGKESWNKYEVFFGSAIRSDIHYYDFLITKFPNIELPLPEIDIWDKYFQFYLNKTTLLKIFDTVINNGGAPVFTSEAETARIIEEIQAEEAEKWRDANSMSKRELADFLGYCDNDIDDISEDDIWIRTGH